MTHAAAVSGPMLNFAAESVFHLMTRQGVGQHGTNFETLHDSEALLKKATDQLWPLHRLKDNSLLALLSYQGLHVRQSDAHLACISAVLQNDGLSMPPPWHHAGDAP